MLTRPANLSPWGDILDALSRWDSDRERLAELRRALGRRAAPRASPSARGALALARDFHPLLGARAAADLMLDARIALPPARRTELLERVISISRRGPCLHKNNEILPFLSEVLALGPETPGCVVEAGVFRGGGTAKITLAAAAVGRRVLACDGFAGLPRGERARLAGTGRAFEWKNGAYRGSLAQARRTVAALGVPEACSFVAGPFEKTLCSLAGPVAAAFVDVDLVSSTRTCVKALYPLMSPGGALYTQDAHSAAVVRLLESERFWRREVRAPRPELERLGPTLARLRKPAKRP